SGRRTLLLVYIHGFNGNETSFQSFPAHLHNLLTVTLGSEEDPTSYLIHTKVYPKFKTRHAITVATLEFSQWLSQFENEMTDIILLGHSMGGILAAEVVLLNSLYSPDFRRHPQILGVVAFDTPFLGMHPGIIGAGIASLFRPAVSPPTEEVAKEDLDPLFAQRPQRNFTVVASKKPETPWESTWHFINKHHKNLTQATGKYLMSHLEFGACLADPIGLKTRYTKIRSLEDGEQMPDGRIERVRFANYYTISYGRDKTQPVVNPPPMPEVEEDIIGATGSFGVMESLEAATKQLAVVGGGATVASSPRLSPSPSPRSADEGHLTVLVPEPMSRNSAEVDPADVDAGVSVEVIPPTPITPAQLEQQIQDELEAKIPVPTAPAEAPLLHEIAEDTEKHLRKALEKENKRLQKEHERTVKEYAKQLKQREKLIQQVRKDREKERAEQAKAEEKQRQEQKRLENSTEKEKQLQFKREDTDLQKQLQKEEEELRKQEEQRIKDEEARLKQEQKEEEKRLKEEQKKNKPPRQRKFCILPSNPDPTWTPVEMKGVDEVGAHCGLFFVGETYAKVVGDVAGRIEEWVGEERSRR
ncbi:hypothetical protein FPQ18DRAFT_232423, partial [Pyronema domesticum]